MNDFLSRGQKIIYAEMRLNNFLNNAEQKIILFIALEIVCAKNRFYECSKQIGIYSKHDGQSANFNNVETDFINAEK